MWPTTKHCQNLRKQRRFHSHPTIQTLFLGWVITMGWRTETLPFLGWPFFLSYLFVTRSWTCGDILPSTNYSILCCASILRKLYLKTKTANNCLETFFVLVISKVCNGYLSVTRKFHVKFCLLVYFDIRSQNSCYPGTHSVDWPQTWRSACFCLSSAWERCVLPHLA